MRYGIRIALASAAILTLASCGGRGEDAGKIPTANDFSPKVDDFPVKLGEPFKVGSITYTPEDSPNYDEVGYASWYGSEMAGNRTANGEAFIPGAVSGAHKTLPLPSYVEVTSLETGRTIIVRINDRGPFANDRLIDLSEGAARQLGIVDQGVAGVRVRRLNPPEQDRAALRSGAPAASRLDTPESLLKVLRERLAKMPKPAGATAISTPPTPKVAVPTAKAQAPTATKPAKEATNPAPSDGRFVREGGKANAPTAPVAKPSAAPESYVVQLAAFSSKASADKLAKQLGATVSTSADGRIHRVRFGPFATEKDAQAALADAKKRGYPQARLLRE